MRPAARSILAACLARALPLLPGALRAGAPAAAAASPWRLVLSDDFDTSLDRGVWATYGGTYGDAGGVSWRDDEVSVSGGHLRIRMERRVSDGKPFSAGGLITAKLAQTYGRFEFRAKVPEGRGIDSYATLWPKQGDRDATLIEILAPGPETAHLTNGYGSGKTGRIVQGRFSDAFHTYTIEWTPSRFRILFDGAEWLSDSHSSRVAKSLGFAMSCGDALTGSPDASTPLPAFFEIDWVRVYRYVPVAAAPATTARPPSTTTTTRPPPSTTTTPATSGGEAAGALADPPTTTVAIAGEPASARRPEARWLVALAAGAAALTTAMALLARRRRGAAPR
jgi:beta-glucanase (GH16 family)